MFMPTWSLYCGAKWYAACVRFKFSRRRHESGESCIPPLTPRCRRAINSCFVVARHRGEVEELSALPYYIILMPNVYLTRPSLTFGIDHGSLRRLCSFCSPADAASGEKPKGIKTHLRNMLIVPEMIGSIVGIYNGASALLSFIRTVFVCMAVPFARHI